MARRPHACLFVALIAAMGASSAVRAEPIAPWLGEKLRKQVESGRALFVGHGRGKTAEDARRMAESDALGQACRCSEAVIESKASGSVLTVYEQGAGSVRADVAQTTSARCRTTMRGFTPVYVEELSESGSPAARGYYAVPRDQLPEGCGSDPLPQSGTHFLWRSAVAPGWGQFEKDQDTKAWLIVISEVAAVSGALVTGLAGRAERDKAAETLFQSERDEHNARADQFYNASLGCTVAAAAIYVFNLADAYGSPPEGSQSAAYVAPVPVIGGAGLQAAVRF